jgi:hypothetical protein
MEFIPINLALTSASSSNSSTPGNETGPNTSSLPTRRPRHLRIRPNYCGTNIPRPDYSTDLSPDRSPDRSPQRHRRSKIIPRFLTISDPPPPNSADPSSDEDEPPPQPARKAARKVSYAEQHLKAILDHDHEFLAYSKLEEMRRKSLNIEVEIEQMELDPNSPTRYVYNPLYSPPTSPESASDDGGFFFRLIKRKLL